MKYSVVEQKLFEAFSQYLAENPPVLFGGEGSGAKAYGRFMGAMEVLQTIHRDPEVKAFISRLITEVNDSYHTGGNFYEAKYRLIHETLSHVNALLSSGCRVREISLAEVKV